MHIFCMYVFEINLKIKYITATCTVIKVKVWCYSESAPWNLKTTPEIPEIRLWDEWNCFLSPIVSGPSQHLDQENPEY